MAYDYVIFRIRLFVRLVCAIIVAFITPVYGLSIPANGILRNYCIVKTSAMDSCSFLRVLTHFFF